MQSKTKKTWVNNTEANQIVSTVQNSLVSGRINKVALKRMMELIICVDGYELKNTRAQGVISTLFNKERLYGSRALTNHFGHDINDMVSVFWEEIFSKLPDAKLTGTDVEVRKIDDTTEDETVNKNGTSYTVRKTSCNPIHWLRNRGVMAVRNSLNGMYRDHLRQTCKTCGTQGSVSTAEKDSSKLCPSCGSTDTIDFYPDGHSSYKSKKRRKCNECEHTWDRQFAHTCYKCGSEDISIESSLSTNNDTLVYVKSEAAPVDEMLHDFRFDAEIAQLLKDLYRALPTDPRDATAFTKTHEVFNILVYPEASRAMCDGCRTRARRVCESECADFRTYGKCEHKLVINQNESCGAEYFSDECVNYSKKIGEYQNCSASLTARRVKKVREYIKMYVITHKGDYVCKELYRLLKKRGLL